MTYRVGFSSDALGHLQVLSLYTSQSYVSRVVSYCYSLSTFPLRGVRRDDIRAGLRITNYSSRTVITFSVDVDAEYVLILGVFHGGQDYETILRDE